MLAPNIAISTFLAACCLGAGLIAAPQSSAPTPASDESPTGLIAEGERLLRTGDKEGAAIMGWRARDRMLAKPEDIGSAVLRSALEGLMMRADPLATRTREEDAAFAARLIDLARNYQRRKLPRRALAVLDLAMRFDPVAAGKVRDYVQKQLPSGPASAAKASTPKKGDAREPAPDRDRLAEAEIEWSDVGWKLEDGVVRSPRLDDGKTKRLMLREPRHGSSDEISWDILLGDSAGHAGVILLAAGTTDYVVVELSHIRDEAGRLASSLQVQQVSDNKAENIASSFFPLTPEQRAAWFSVRVFVRGDRLEIPVPGGQSVQVAIAGKLGDGLGFFVSGNSDYKDPVLYRNLRVQPAPEQATEKKAAASQPTLDPRIAIVDELLARQVAAKDLDEHLVEMHRTLEELDAVSDPTLRELLDLRLREGVAKSDPLAKLALTVREERARTLVARSAGYRDAQCPRLSLAVLRGAARYDWRAAKDPYLALLASLAPPPPPPIPPARPSELLTWFAEMEPIEGRGGWSLSAERLTPPLVDKAENLAVVSKRRQPERGTLRWEFVMTPESAAGLVFDYRSMHDLAVAWLVTSEGRLRLEVLRVFAGNRTIFGVIDGPALPSSGPVFGSMSLEFLDGKAHLRLFGSAPLEVPLASRAAMPRLGIHCQTAASGVEVRNWFVEAPATPEEKR